jgi:PAS domain-containing protein
MCIGHARRKPPGELVITARHPEPDAWPRVERRARVPRDQTPKLALAQIPTLVILERIPVPVLAIDDAGVTVFTNTAFAQMLGYTTAHVSSLTFADLVGRPRVDSAVNGLRDGADYIVDLVSADGFYH